MMFKFIKDLAVKAFVGFLEFQQRRTMAEIRRRLAVRYGRLVQHTAVGVRRAAWGLLAVAAVGAGLALLPVTVAAMLLGICSPDSWQTAVLLAAMVVGGFALAYVSIGVGVLWVATSETAVRKLLHAEDVERQLRGDD